MFAVRRMSVQDGVCLGVFGAEVVGNRRPLANISVKGPPGFRFGFSLPFFTVAVGLCICMIHGNVCVIKLFFISGYKNYILGKSTL